MVSLRQVTASLLFASLNLAGFSSAQDESSPYPTSAPTTVISEESPTSTRGPITHTVDVGDAGNHKFKPDLITGLPGDTIEFLFGPTNHSVVRAEYEHPCIPYEMTGRGKVGFFSGFHAVDTYDSQVKWSLKINDTDPIFFYCSAPESCLTWQMIGVINPNGSVSLARQKQLAAEADYMLNPGEPFPAEASSTMASLTEDPTSRPTGGAANNGNGNENAGSHGGLSSGAIAGIAVGAAAIVALAGGLFFYMGRSKGYKFALKRSDATVPRTTPGNDYMAPPGHPDMYQASGMYAPSDAHRSMGTMSPPPPFSSPMMYPKDQHHVVGEMESPALNNRDTYNSSVFTEHIPPSDRYSVHSERKSAPRVHEMYAPPNSPPGSPPLGPPTPDPSKSPLNR